MSTTDCRFPEHMTAITLLQKIVAPYRPMREASRPRGVTEAIALLDRLDALSDPASAAWCPVCKNYHTEPGERTDAGKLTRQCSRIPADDLRNRP